MIDGLLLKSLKDMSDQELMELLDSVSNEFKRRNSSIGNFKLNESDLATGMKTLVDLIEKGLKSK
jgi:hypothetical protein